MLPRLSTLCLRTTTARYAFQIRQPLIRSLYTTTPRQPLLWKPTQITKRIFTTSKPTFIPKTTPPVVVQQSKKVPTVGGSTVDVNKRNATDWAIIRQLMKYIWPKNDIGVKSRVVIALGLLLGGKVSLCLDKEVFMLTNAL